MSVERGRPRILFLSEGDPENPVASGSGTPSSVIEHLRKAGLSVHSADVDVRRLQKGLLAALTFARRRETWRARYHIAPIALRMRSRNAEAAARRHAKEIDVVLQYGGTFGVRHEPGVPYFLFCDNHIANSIRQPRSWGAQMTPAEADAAIAWQAALFRGAAAIFTFSEFIRGSFLEHYALEPRRVITVGSGPNLPLAQIPRLDRRRAGSGAPTILFVGRDFEHKGGPVMLSAFRLVRERIPDARLLIVGPSALRVDEPGVENLGFLRKDDPTDFGRLLQAYAEAEVFCLPTRYESFGIAFVEAMWFGLPVVAPAHWAIPEIVEEGETGLLVRDESPEEYASRLLALLQDPQRARTMGEQGRRRAESRFSWEFVARQMTTEISRHLAR